MDGSSLDGLHHRASGVRPAGTYHRVGSLRRTKSVAIEAIADILRSLAARRGDANDPNRSSNWGVAENLREQGCQKGRLRRHRAIYGQPPRYPGAVTVSTGPGARAWPSNSTAS